MNIDFKKLSFLQRETFISLINHDLKVPILAQIRALELLEKIGTLNIEQKEIINLTLDSCRSMYEIMTEMLSIYKYENKDFILNPEPLNFLDLLEECIKKMSEKIIKKQIQFIIKNDASQFVIYGDMLQLSKALEYILNYNLQCTDKNTDFIIKTNNINNYLKINMSFQNSYNTDIIYKPHKMDKIGKNLGLYLAQQIIYAHKGNIYTERNGNITSYTILMNVKFMPI